MESTLSRRKIKMAIAVAINSKAPIAAKMVTQPILFSSSHWYNCEPHPAFEIQIIFR